MSDAKKRTITLTGRAPVTISEESWPIIAAGRADWHDGQVEYQANQRTAVRVLVRQHADGRAIVYGTYSYSSAFEDQRGRGARAGVLLTAGADLADAISGVAASLTADAGDDAAYVREAELEAIADLPAEVLE
jgi:hypothetical protein